MERISVIIPVYNAQKYVKRCIESVCQQSYPEYEIIIVDDGSTDNSAQICKELAAKHSNIKYIAQSNKGVSAARNLGMQNATGQYLVFIDSDDYVLNDMLQYLYLGMKKAELSVCGNVKTYVKEDVERTETEKKEKKFTEKNLTAREYMEMLFHPDVKDYQGYVWGKMYHANIIKQNNLQFDETIKYNEDRLFVLNYLFYCNSVHYSEAPKYVYVQNEDSVMAALNKKYSVGMLTELYAFDSMIKLLKNHEGTETITYYALDISRASALKLMNVRDNYESDKAFMYAKKWSLLLLKQPEASLYKKIKIILRLIIAKVK